MKWIGDFAWVLGGDVCRVGRVGVSGREGGAGESIQPPDRTPPIYDNTIDVRRANAQLCAFRFSKILFHFEVSFYQRFTRAIYRFRPLVTYVSVD